jgi:phage tail-like protein
MPLQVEYDVIHRFVIEIDNQRMAAFTECSLPNLEIEVAEQKEGGQNEYIHMLPVRRKSGRLTLKSGLTNNADLLKMYLKALDGNIQSATCKLSVIMLDRKSKELARWDFGKAIPVKWTGPQMKSDQSAVIIETLEFVVHDFAFQ